MGKSKKRAREKAKQDVLSLDGTRGTLSVAAADPRKIAKLSLKVSKSVISQQALGSAVNVVEVDGKTCTHEVAWPPPLDDEDPAALSGEPVVQSLAPPPAHQGPPAKEYKFALDPFQQTAIACLEHGHSVLVAAHTSAGKTVVAEYAFAMALRDGQRVIYTSPLKALSNQKYRELAEEFRDVGLMTGDVTINPDATCLVMTTEILRSMLYRGSSTTRETQLIVFDEIHYLRDKERGVVWEECIILMPKQARFVFLSATIPNAREFADWIAKVHRSPCHVVYTDFRPTPLQHYIFPAGAENLYMVVDEKSRFREDNFQAAIAALTDGADDDSKSSKGGKGKKGGKDVGRDEKSDIFKLVKMIVDRQYHPVIIFSFSKKECESLALQMVSLELNDAEEASAVASIFGNALDVLSQDDQRLPQIHAILPMLKRGIGIHHSGLLPILKELVELLFQEGLLKVLFATETFSTGLNMPAKTVVFTSARKFDGGGFRWVSSGEYIQMSGRAGRRGLDDRGIVILMLDTKMEPSIAKDMVRGAPDALWSEFRLGYAPLLAQLRSEDADPEVLLGASFRQFQLQRALPALQAAVSLKESERDAIHIRDEAAVVAYAALLQQASAARATARAASMAPAHALPFLQPGRLVRILTDRDGLAVPPSLAEMAGPEQLLAADGGGLSEESGRWGIIINFERLGKKDAATASVKASRASYIVDVLVNCQPGSSGGSQAPRAPRLLPADSRGSPLIVPFPLEQVDAFSSIRMYVAKDLRQPEPRATAVQQLAEVMRRFADKPPTLDAEEDLGCGSSSEFKAARRTLEKTERLLSAHPLSGTSSLAQSLAQLARKQAAEVEVATLRSEVRSAQTLVLRDELQGRRRVLRRLGHLTPEGLVTTKGIMAAGIQSGDELVLTEMIFNGAFTQLSSQQCVALLSAFVWTEKSEAGAKVREDLEAPWLALQEAARRVAKTANDSKLVMDVPQYVASFRPELMEIVSAWARGARFADLLRTTDIFEGSLVRTVRREEELLRQLVAACQVIGEEELAAKFEDCIVRIKRDIIFAASLYL